MKLNCKKCFYPVLLVVFLFSGTAKSQSPICYTAFQVCGDPFRMMFIGSNMPEVGDMLYFYSESNPSSNGYYMVDSEYNSVPGSNQTWFNIPSVPCGYYDAVMFPDGTIIAINPEGSGMDCWCEVKPFNGCSLPPGFEIPLPYDLNCEEWINHCGEEIVNELIIRDLTVDGCEQWIGDCGPSSKIYRYGAVGIGTSTEPAPFPPSNSHKLYVEGGILTEQLKLIGTNSNEWGNIDHHGNVRSWCDYVFEEDYPLLSLVEVEHFIQENRHLPETPSAKELEEMGGFDMGSVLLNHQEKIEEVFLHLFDIKDQIGQMEKALSDAENKNN